MASVNKVILISDYAGGMSIPEVSNKHGISQSAAGRKILPDEVVHHIDGDRNNNNINNLALMTRSAHSRLHRREDQISNNNRKRSSDGRFC